MKVLSPRGPWTAAETVAQASTFQTICNLAVEAAGFKPVMAEYARRKPDTGTIPVPRVYVELTHSDVWTVNSNDPEHPELEEACKAAIENYLRTSPTPLSDCDQCRTIP